MSAPASAPASALTKLWVDLALPEDLSSEEVLARALLRLYGQVNELAAISVKAARTIDALTKIANRQAEQLERLYARDGR